MSAQRYYVVRNDTIENTILYDPANTYDPGDGAELHLASSIPNVGVGWRKLDGVWTAPPRDTD
jgi:hypothetical protein